MRRIVLHGHFYQPPREEPWLELVPREQSASPDHDWNERITRQCYAPLTRARVLDQSGFLRRVINAWGWCSFDVGPTLFHWLDQHAPEVAQAIVAADHASQIRLGAGNAMAMPYHHIIMPLASYRDKVTEVRWGIRHFRERFGREPEGMWLPETAMDEESLVVLADEGIKFTVLAPHQVATSLEFGRPGRWRSGDRSLALFTYDGALSHDIAFGDLLRDADRWAEKMVARPMAGDGGLTIETIATDGETFGHHHRFGDLALAAFIDHLEARSDMTLTNFAAILNESPPVQDVEVVGPTSWSCAHGIERWRSDCGCRFDVNTSQAWRTPLREGLDHLANQIHEISEQQWPENIGELWTTRESAGPELVGVEDLPVVARRILEAERHVLAMFTSCGWFFDDIGRLEPRLILRHAARALDFIPPERRHDLESQLLARLGETNSYDYKIGNGVEIWHRDVLSEADGPARLAAGLAALRVLAPGNTAEFQVSTHSWRVDGDQIVTHHKRTGAEFRWQVEPTILGVVAAEVIVTPLDSGEARAISISRYPSPVRTLLREIVAPLVVSAALSEADREALTEGLLDAEALRERALVGAWSLVERDGLALADIVVHAALDLFDLDEVTLPDHLRIDAFERLRSSTPSPSRDTLAKRLWLAIPESA